MIKKGILFFILVIFVIAIAGCQTLKGAAVGATEGAKKDWQTLLRVDEWMRENLW